MTIRPRLLAAGLALVFVSSARAGVDPAPEDPRLSWGRERVWRALDTAGYVRDAVTLELTVDPQSPQLPQHACRAEGHAVTTAADHISVTGFDPAGVLYGCVDLAGEIERQGELVEPKRADAPVLALRGPGMLLMKLGRYNFAVTPEEFPFFYDRAQWLRWLDFMADRRFNCISLWNGHPFARNATERVLIANTARTRNLILSLP